MPARRPGKSLVQSCQRKLAAHGQFQISGIVSRQIFRAGEVQNFMQRADVIILGDYRQLAGKLHTVRNLRWSDSSFSFGLHQHVADFQVPQRGYNRTVSLQSIEQLSCSCAGFVVYEPSCGD